MTVEDDVPVDCTKVKVAYVLGHDEHGHPIMSATTGCTGTITTSAAGPRGGHRTSRAVFSASYTDAPAEGAPPLTGTDQVELVPGG